MIFNETKTIESLLKLVNNDYTKYRMLQIMFRFLKEHDINYHFRLKMLNVKNVFKKNIMHIFEHFVAFSSKDIRYREFEETLFKEIYGLSVNEMFDYFLLRENIYDEFYFEYYCAESNVFNEDIKNDLASLKDMINYAFFWDETEKGDDFWSDYDDGLEQFYDDVINSNIKLSTEIIKTVKELKKII